MIKPGSGIMFDQPVQPKVHSKFEQRDIKNSFNYETSKEKLEHKLKHNTKLVGPDMTRV